MPEKKVEDFTHAELVDELQHYQDTGVFSPEDFTGATNDKKRIELITILREKNGVPHQVTEDEEKATPGAVAGTWILVPVVEPPLPPTEPPVPPAAPVVVPPAPKGKGKGTLAAHLATTGPGKKEETKTLFFKGKPIIRVENKVVNGRLYKEVVRSEDSQLLSLEEYQKQVTEGK